MFRRTLTAVMLLLALAAGRATSQDKKESPKNPEMEAYAKAAEPGPEHKALEPLVGNWTYSVKFWPAPGQPPLESKGTCERKWIMGGRFIEERVQGDAMGGPQAFAGLGLIGYDKPQKKYTTAWVDSMTTSITSSFGTADAAGKTFTFNTETIHPVKGTKVKGKDVIRILGNDQHEMEMFKEGPDGKEWKSMELKLARKK